MGLRFPWLRRCACGNATCVFLGGPKGGVDGEKKQQKLAFSWHHVLQTLESCFLSECRSGLVFEHVGHSEGKLVYLSIVYEVGKRCCSKSTAPVSGDHRFFTIGKWSWWLQKSRNWFIATSLTSPIVAMMSFWSLMDDSMIMFAPKFQILRWIKPFTGNPVRFTVSTHSPCVSLTMLLLDFEVVIRACQHCRQL